MAHERPGAALEENRAPGRRGELNRRGNPARRQRPPNERRAAVARREKGRVLGVGHGHEAVARIGEVDGHRGHGQFPADEVRSGQCADQRVLARPRPDGEGERRQPEKDQGQEHTCERHELSRHLTLSG